MATIRRKSGLPLDPMFSAAKARWLLDGLPHGQARAKAGEICIGTIDAFLLSRFGGEAVIEAGNASRTQLFDVVRAAWDEELLAIFDVPVAALPRIVSSIGPFPKRVGWPLCRTARPSARCLPTRMPPCSPTARSLQDPSRRRMARVRG